MATLLDSIMSFLDANSASGLHRPRRENWDDYFMAIAYAISSRSTCTRLQVGCVLTRDNRMLVAGYNGSMRGKPHCVDVGCHYDTVGGGCTRTVHAEQNAICSAADNGVSLSCSIAYVTHAPCKVCAMMLVNAGVDAIVYSKSYRVSDHLMDLPVMVRQLKGSDT